MRTCILELQYGIPKLQYYLCVDISIVAYNCNLKGFYRLVYMLRCSKADFEEVDFFRVETLTKRGRGRPKRVRIEEPDYTGQDKASSSVPQPDTEADQPVSVWLAPSTPLMLGYRLLLLLLLSRGCPKKVPSSDNQETSIY